MQRARREEYLEDKAPGEGQPMRSGGGGGAGLLTANRPKIREFPRRTDGTHDRNICIHEFTRRTDGTQVKISENLSANRVKRAKMRAAFWPICD